MAMTRLCIAVCLCLIASVQAFVPPATARRACARPRASRGSSSPVPRMGLGDAFKKAFENEDMGKRVDPGLSRAPKKVMVTVDGKQIECVAGQRLRDVCRAARVQVKYGCEKGDCGTCEGLGDGRKIRICTGIVPRNKDTFTLQTKK